MHQSCDIRTNFITKHDIFKSSHSSNIIKCFCKGINAVKSRSNNDIEEKKMYGFVSKSSLLP